MYEPSLIERTPLLINTVETIPFRAAVAGIGDHITIKCGISLSQPGVHPNAAVPEIPENTVDDSAPISLYTYETSHIIIILTSGYGTGRSFTGRSIGHIFNGTQIPLWRVFPKVTLHNNLPDPYEPANIGVIGISGIPTSNRIIAV